MCFLPAVVSFPNSRFCFLISHRSVWSTPSVVLECSYLLFQLITFHSQGRSRGPHQDLFGSIKAHIPISIELLFGVGFFAEDGYLKIYTTRPSDYIYSYQNTTESDKKIILQVSGLFIFPRVSHSFLHCSVMGWTLGPCS